MMKRVFALFLMVCCFMLVSYAQPHPKMDPAAKVEKLTEQLSLTNEQAEQVTVIFTDLEAQMKDLFENGDPRDESTHAKMDSLRTVTDEAIMKILTEDQQTAYKKILEEEQQRMKDHEPPKNN